ncbi:hypothetical protein KAI04_03200 [Candidatus Pacearchaeota archaeon]|nr:hypothetical protein [Candidatus Pacearchaeota archaeon]
MKNKTKAYRIEIEFLSDKDFKDVDLEDFRNKLIAPLGKWIQAKLEKAFPDDVKKEYTFDLFGQKHTIRRRLITLKNNEK